MYIIILKNSCGITLIYIGSGTEKSVGVLRRTDQQQQ
jgi:hypothetical protein